VPEQVTVTESGWDGVGAELVVLVRQMDQLEAAINLGMETIYCEFEDPRQYGAAVERVRRSGSAEIWVAPPRITKPGENWILEQVARCDADGYLVRNYDQLAWFAQKNGLRCIGDFSLNVANALTADYLQQRFGLERLTASYDLNIQQLQDLIATCPPNWLEITIHQHMPMFHMEHCVFCAFLSEGTDFTNCGRPCETHEVELLDRAGVAHPLKADAGCRNTVFNGKAQTGAESVQRLMESGANRFRIEFVNESAPMVEATIERYQQLLEGEMTGRQLWRELSSHSQLGQLNSQLGVTRGPLADDRSRTVSTREHQS
jgi:U32 family peptidase